MIYESTRGGGGVSAAAAIARGQAPDGGLYLPSEFPGFSSDDIRALESAPYYSRAARVMARLLPEFPESVLESMAGQAYSAFDAPVVSVGGAHILELFRGPTCAFKDFALQMLPRLLTASLMKTGAPRGALMLAATSGDTGTAALRGFAGDTGGRVCVFYPHGAVSDIQRLQMTTQAGENVLVLAVRGNFDDAQRQVKAMLGDEGLREKLDARGFAMSSANSINWGRLAPQVAYYFSAYCDMARNGAIAWGDKINIAVPTGNFGNILAAFIAKNCGLPVNRLICASNKNRVLADFFASGRYDARREFFVTSSPSMDILVSSNLERLLYLLSGRNAGAVGGWMGDLAREGNYTVDAATHGAMGAHFWAGWCDEDETAREIARMRRESGYIMDTHTAVAGKVWRDYARLTDDTRPALIAATASPFKFPAAVLGALGERVPADPFEQIAALERVSGTQAPHSLKSLREARERFTDVINPEQMQSAVERWMEL